MQHRMQYSVITFATLIVAAAPAPAGDDAEWTQLGGPTGGMVRDMTFDGDRAWAAGDRQLFTSTDDGISWQSVDALTVDSLIVDIHLSDSAVFVQTGFNPSLSNHLHRSVDQGATWQAIDTPGITTGLTLAVDGDVLIAYGRNDQGNDVLLRSFDLGDTWEALPRTPEMFNAIRFNDGVLLGLPSFGGPHRSFDLGETWLPPTGELGQDIFTFLIKTPDLVLMDGMFSGTMWRTVDGGESWQTVELPIAGQIHGRSAASSGSSIFVAIGYNGFMELWTSDDLGLTWSMPAGSGFPVQSNTINHTSIAAHGTTVLMAAGQSSIWRSADVGDTFARSDDGFITTNVGAVGSIGGTLLTGPAIFGPAHRSTDGGATWTRIELRDIGPEIHDFLALDQMTVLAGTRGLGVFRSFDGGATWQDASAGLPDYIPLDGGAFEPITSFARIDEAIFVGTGGANEFIGGDPHCGCTGTVSGDGVYRSTNGGNSWQRVSNGLPINMIGIDGPILRPITDMHASGNVLLAATPAHGVFRSTNLGASWSPTSGIGGASMFAQIGETIFAVNGSDEVFLSTNQGQSWSMVSTDLSAEAQLAVLTAHDGALFAAGGSAFGASTGMWRSTDGGESWSMMNGLESAVVLSLHEADGTLHAGTKGFGVWRLDEAGLEGDLNSDGSVDVFDLLILLSVWGDCADPGSCPADLNGDATVNVFDLLIVLGHWGK